MSSIYLADYIDNASLSVSRLAARLASGSASWRDVQELCTAYRQRGVCSLLLEGTPNGFRDNMMQSASAFLHFLSVCPDEHKVTSHAKPLFDALAGGFLDAAAAIARRSRKTWHAGQEYEDDFLYVLCLMGLIDPSAGIASPAETLVRLEQVHDGAEPTRIQLCTALLERNAQGFDDAVAKLIDERIEQVEGMVRRGALSPELQSWLCHFSSEATALVCLAGQLGIPTSDEYLHVPSAVRDFAPVRFDVEAWHQYSEAP